MRLKNFGLFHINADFVSTVRKMQGGVEIEMSNGRQFTLQGKSMEEVIAILSDK